MILCRSFKTWQDCLKLSYLNVLFALLGQGRDGDDVGHGDLVGDAMNGTSTLTTRWNSLLAGQIVVKLSCPLKRWKIFHFWFQKPFQQTLWFSDHSRIFQSKDGINSLWSKLKPPPALAPLTSLLHFRVLDLVYYF